MDDLTGKSWAELAEHHADEAADALVSAERDRVSTDTLAAVTHGLLAVHASLREIVEILRGPRGGTGQPCDVCGYDGWPEGSAGNARDIHMRDHARKGERPPASP